MLSAAASILRCTGQTAVSRRNKTSQKRSRKREVENSMEQNVLNTQKVFHAKTRQKQKVAKTTATMLSLFDFYLIKLSIAHFLTGKRQ